MNEISSGIVYRFTGHIFVKQYTRIIYLFYDSQYTTILPINTFISRLSHAFDANMQNKMSWFKRTLLMISKINQILFK